MEVNCAEPFPLVSIPWPNAQHWTIQVMQADDQMVSEDCTTKHLVLS